MNQLILANGSKAHLPFAGGSGSLTIARQASLKTFSLRAMARLAVSPWRAIASGTFALRDVFAMMVCGRQGILDAQPPCATAARPATEKIVAQARGAGRALFSNGACILINRHYCRAAEAKARHATGADRDFEKYRELLRHLMDMPDREAGWRGCAVNGQGRQHRYDDDLSDGRSRTVARLRQSDLFPSGCCRAEKQSQ